MKKEMRTIDVFITFDKEEFLNRDEALKHEKNNEIELFVESVCWNGMSKNDVLSVLLEGFDTLVEKIQTLEKMTK